MKKIYVLPFFFLLSISLFSQVTNPNCDGVRFLTEVFPDQPTMTTMKFGENTTIDGNFQELFMDIFEPAGDVAENRPVLMFAFGGSFIAGSRDATHDLCRTFARKGFVTAAIDYRLYDRNLPPFGPIPDSLDMIDVVMKSVADYKAAIRFLRKDADTDNQFRIDPNFIFSGGISAGSIASLHAAFLDDGEAPDYVQNFIDSNGGFEGDTDDPDNSNMGYSSEIQGVVNHYGALHRKDWIDAGDPPMISVHGDADGTVPYGRGNAVVVIIPIVTVEGSGVMHPRADEVGIKNELITVPGGGHGGFPQIYNDSMEMRTARFLTEILCGDFTSVEEPKELVVANAFPNPSIEQMQVVLGENFSDYNVRVSNQLGQTVFLQNSQNQSQFMLERSEIGSGVFVLNIDFKDKNILPVRRKIIFR